MSTETVVLLSTLGSMGQMFLTGTIGSMYYQIGKKKCDLSRKECEKKHMHRTESFLVGFGWPISLPTIGGVILGKQVFSLSDWPARREQRKAIAHRRKIELINAEAAKARAEKDDAKAVIDYLEKNNIRASVPGMFEPAS